MSSIPKRKEKSILADILIRHNKYDLFLFIEDEKMPHVYKKIISRLYNNDINIGKIYPMKSKKNVLDKFEKWRTNQSHLKKCFFIVDKDFDHFNGEFSPNHTNLIELEYYTIENYLISEPGVVALLQSKIFHLDEDEIYQMLDWDNWLDNIYDNLKRLFIVYAIANKYKLKENCSISPYRYLKKNSFEIDSVQVDEYIEEIRQTCVSRSDIDFNSEYAYIENYYNENGTYQYGKLIKGKYIYAALYKYLNHLVGKKIDEDMGSLIIADNMSLADLSFLKRKLKVK